MENSEPMRGFVLPPSFLLASFHLFILLSSFSPFFFPLFSPSLLSSTSPSFLSHHLLSSFYPSLNSVHSCVPLFPPPFIPPSSLTPYSAPCWKCSSTGHELPIARVLSASSPPLSLLTSLISLSLCHSHSLSFPLLPAFIYLFTLFSFIYFYSGWRRGANLLF